MRLSRALAGVVVLGLVLAGALWAAGVALSWGTLAAAQALLVVAGCALVMLVQVVAWERGRAPRLMAIGVACAIVAALIALSLVLVDGDGRMSAVRERAAASWLGVAVVNAVIGIALLQPARQGAARLVCGATIGLTALLLVPWGAVVWLDGADVELLSRIMGATGLLVVGGLITGLVLARSRGIVEDAAAAAQTVAVRCPRCGLDQTLRSGGDACAQCHLRIKVVIL